MASIASQLDEAFRRAIREAFDGLDADPLVVAAQNERFGDYQSNAAMGLAKAVAQRTGQNTNPRAVAEQIVAKLQLGDMSDERPTIAGPGFINVRLSPAWLARRLREVAADERLGVERTGAPQRVVVDYSAPNIAKEMHVGHIRSTIIGDAAARVLSFRGDDVVRQNHLGDWGTQFGRVVLSMWYEAVFERSGNERVLSDLIGQPVERALPELVRLHQRFIDEDPDGRRYFVPYLREDTLQLAQLERVYQFVSRLTESEAAGKAIINHPQHGPRSLAELPRLVTTFIQNPEEHEQERMAWEKARRVTLESCKLTYRQLGVQLADPGIQPEPLERGESFYNPFLPDVVRELREKGLAVESEGAIVVHVPGHENPLIIQKADGSYLYGTTDLAAVRFRVRELGAKRILYFVDARQSQHFAQVFWTAQAAGWTDGVALEHASFGTMLGPDKRPFKTRSGDTVKLKDLLDEAEERAATVIAEKNPELPEDKRREIAHAVGIGAIKYADLSKDRVSDYVFSWEQMLSFEGNTAPYLQNAYVRIRAIFRRAGTDANPRAEIMLNDPHEQSLAKHLLRSGDAINLVARELKPHHLATYLYDVATKFHAFYEHCPVIQSDEPLRSSRLALCDVTARTLAQGLDLLGIEHPEQM